MTDAKRTSTASPVVLVVDDDPGIRALLARWLQEDAYESVEAASAEAALELVIKNGKIGVVICDLVMPGNGGLWLLQQLRQHAPTVGVILGTANGEVPGAVALAVGVVAYLVKPFARHQFRRAVADATQWHQGFARERSPHPSNA